MQRFALAARKEKAGKGARRILEIVEKELELVEDEFEQLVSSNIQVVNYLGNYLRESGGKRVRPALVILANYAVGGDGRSASIIRLATVMEMLHTATLVHDDIIDNADTRRNRSSVNARYGNQAAVLMGDWLYMSAFEASLSERSLAILDILTQLTRKMTEGELIQLTAIGRLDLTEDEYFDILRRKTAYLFSSCCEVGALLEGADEKAQRALREFGLDLGIIFQLSDDLLDLMADDASLGKSAGADLLEGKITLPLIYLAEKERSIVPMLERIMIDGEYGILTREVIQQKLIDHGILNDIRSLIDRFAADARKNLVVLPESEYRKCLDDLLGFLIERNS